MTASAFSVGQSMMVAPEQGRRFYGEAEVLPQAITAEEAMRRTGMDYEVKGLPIFDANGDRITGYKRLTREDNPARTFGIVTDRYKIAQNRNVFTLADHVQAQGVMCEAGGIIDEGRKAWLLMRMPEPVRAAGEDITPWILLINGHDGGQGFGAVDLPMRPSCTNALPWAFKSPRTGRTRRRGLKLHHTGDIGVKIADAHRLLEVTQEYYNDFATVADLLAQKRLADRKLNRLLEELYPAGTSDRQVANAEERREVVKRLTLEAPNLEGHHGTAWAFVNAVAEVADWGSTRQRDRMDRLAWNADGAIKNKALELALGSVN